MTQRAEEKPQTTPSLVMRHRSHCIAELAAGITTWGGLQQPFSDGKGEPMPALTQFTVGMSLHLLSEAFR